MGLDYGDPSILCACVYSLPTESAHPYCGVRCDRTTMQAVLSWRNDEVNRQKYPIPSNVSLGGKSFAGRDRLADACRFRDLSRRDVP